MALEYELTLAGDISGREVAGRAFPDAAQRPTGVSPLLSIGLYEQLGFGVSVLEGHRVYFSVDSDQGMWEWEPDISVSVTFRMDKFADRKWAVNNMIMVVRRVLSSGAEDSILVLNSDVLLFARFDGKLVKHQRHGWWASYPGADDLISADA